MVRRAALVVVAASLASVCSPLAYPYYLQSNSPCRGSGLDPSPGNGVPVPDREYRLRPGDNDTDMGANEDSPACP